MVSLRVSLFIYLLALLSITEQHLHVNFTGFSLTLALIFLKPWVFSSLFFIHSSKTLKKVQSAPKMIRFSRARYTNTANTSFPVGIMKSELIKCQWSGAAALSINAFFLAPLCAALLEMKQDSQRRLSGIPRSAQPSAVCPSNSSCPLTATSRTFHFFLGGGFCVILIWGGWRHLNTRLDVPGV